MSGKSSAGAQADDGKKLNNCDVTAHGRPTGLDERCRKDTLGWYGILGFQNQCVAHPIELEHSYILC